VTAFTERYASPVLYFINVPKQTSDKKYKNSKSKHVYSGFLNRYSSPLSRDEALTSSYSCVKKSDLYPVARVQVGSAIMALHEEKLQQWRGRRQEKRVLTASGNVEITGRREMKYCDKHKVAFTSQL